MASFAMPVGKPILFEGDITKVEPNAFGFFRCEITSPENLEHPILLRKIRTGSGIRTIAGLGAWTGIVNSHEMRNAEKYGYKFKVLGGVTFKTDFIFKKFVEDLYRMRQEYSRTDPMNLICKLILNSLYGKFGQSLEYESLVIYDISTLDKQDKVNKIISEGSSSIKDWISISENLLAILKGQSNRDDYDNYHGANINVAIAATITGAARVVMSFYKNNPLWRLFYSDTDSIIIDRELPSELVGNKLGQMKREYKLTGFIGLAPKVYCLETENGTLIKKMKRGGEKAICKFLNE